MVGYFDMCGAVPIVVWDHGDVLDDSNRLRFSRVADYIADFPFHVHRQDIYVSVGVGCIFICLHGWSAPALVDRCVGDRAGCWRQVLDAIFPREMSFLLLEIVAILRERRLDDGGVIKANSFQVGQYGTTY